MQELKQAIKQACQNLFNVEVEPEMTRPDEKFGDLATNVALQLAKKAAVTPNQIAQQLMAELQGMPGIKQIGIAGPGFINFTLTDEALQSAVLKATDLPKPNVGQEILVEFGDPNPFKEMHIGHLYSYITGDAISSLLEISGAQVKRLSYHGDVGLHVAQAIWAMLKETKALKDDLGYYYALGAKAFTEDEQAANEIRQINAHIYKRDDEKINRMHEQGTRKSFAEFDGILKTLGIKTDRRYPESEVTPVGIESVRENIGPVFKYSQGAIIYDGEKVGLHIRVFITAQGIPTYEAKDLGLAALKNIDFPEAAKSIVITASEQAEYFKVMLAALAQINPPLAKKTAHLSHGFVNLSSGKMSSRTGEVYAAKDLIDEVQQAASQQFPDSQVNDQTALAALKYDFLKPRLGGDITFDVKESVSLEGNSGPYLQYAHARACSILAKAEMPAQALVQFELDKSERSLVRKISEYPEVIDKAVRELMPHHVCTYLYELAQAFNGFYETSRIIGDERESLRLQLVRAYQQVLKSGLQLLNISAPEKI